MKIFRVIIVVNIFLVLISCGTLKEGFINQKKNNSDEFLVQKKSPLVMPPDYDKLPAPNNEVDEVQNSKSRPIKKLLSNKDDQEENSNVNTNSKNKLKKKLLEKIKNN